ncbi:MAG: hypothetical protein K6F15_06095 [Treponema sp.]|nr:hypothetical protein [Treponema sp.]
MNGDGNTFSTKASLMTAVAKIASEVSGKEIDPYLDVNQKIDKNKDGKLSVDEISNGLNSLKRELIKGRNPGKAACRGICAHIIKNNLNLLGDCGF